MALWHEVWCGAVVFAESTSKLCALTVMGGALWLPTRATHQDTALSRCILQLAQLVAQEGLVGRKPGNTAYLASRATVLRAIKQVRVAAFQQARGSLLKTLPCAAP